LAGEATGGKGEMLSPVFSFGPKVSSGLGRFVTGWAEGTVEVARVHSAISYFSFDLIQFKFKSSLKSGNS
jgi:hypothetical protein